MEKNFVLKDDGSMKYIYDRYAIHFTSHAIDRIWERKENIPYKIFFDTIKHVAESLMETKTVRNLFLQGYSNFIIRSQDGITMVFGISAKTSLALVTVWNEADLGHFKTKGDPELTCTVTRKGLQFKHVNMKEIAYETAI